MKPLNKEELQKLLEKNTVLNKLIYFDSIDSTNKFLSENDQPSGTVVIASEQTAGRGKHGAKWVSGRGGLWFSYVIRKKIKRPYDHVIISSLAVSETLDKYGIKAVIKWPNDVMAYGMKIAGILLENDYYGARLITGIGINVNNSLPGGPGIKAISAKLAAGKMINPDSLAADIIKRIDRYMSGLPGKRVKIVNKWIRRQKDLSGSEIFMVKAGKRVGFKVIEVLKDGIKVIGPGKRVKILSGEVFFK